MPKFKTLNNQIPGLIRNCSPIRNEERKGVAYQSKGAIFMREIYKDYLDVIPSAVQHRWILDLRDLTGAFHAAQYIDDHRDKFEPKDFSDALNDELGPDYHHVYLKAGTGGLLTAAERRSLAKIVLWVAERVG